MEHNSYTHLKSGSDVRGVAIETDDKKITLTFTAVKDITAAFLRWLSDKTGKNKLKIAVGKDVRLSGDEICSAILQALEEGGCDAVYCGLSSTPSMFVLLKESNLGCDASVMVTASHLPYYMNGLKFFIPSGGLGGSDIEKILALASEGAALKGQGATYTEQSFMGEYCAKLVNAVRQGTGCDKPLLGKKIIVDAGNGAGGFFEAGVLQELGADTQGSVNMNPDGRFPAHIPNPEAPEAISALRAAVLASKADLGVIFDTDVDRAALVDGDGNLINRDTLIALVSATILEDGPATIVTDSVTSDGLTEFILSRNGRHVRFKRGYKNVIDEAIRRNALGEYCPLAIETSGHAAFKENYFLDDGAYLICKILVTYSRPAQKNLQLKDLIATLKRPLEEAEIRIKFNELSKDFKAEGNGVIEDLTSYADGNPSLTLAPDNYEGVRINFPDGEGGGWLLLRMSVHEPVIPINFASRQKGGDKIMAAKLKEFLQQYPFLDLTKLDNFIK